MRTVPIAAVSLVALAFLGGPASAPGERSATAAALKKNYCSPTGDYCINVFGKKPAKIRLVLASFSFDGGYELCVDPPRGDEECKTFTLKPEEFALYGSVVKWQSRVRRQRCRDLPGPLALPRRPARPEARLQARLLSAGSQGLRQPP